MQMVPGETGMGKCRFSGDFRLDRSFLDLRGRGYNNATQGNKDRPGRALLNTYLLRVPSLA